MGNVIEELDVLRLRIKKEMSYIRNSVEVVSSNAHCSPTKSVNEDISPRNRDATEPKGLNAKPL